MDPCEGPTVVRGGSEGDNTSGRPWASGEGRERFASTGVAVLRSVFRTSIVSGLQRWVGAIEVAPSAPDGPMHHLEATASGAVIARTERFADHHVGLGRFLRGDLADLVAEVCAEPVLLFKEKVNYKYPGGAGFAPHQDARAYRFAQRHISVMVPLDAATERSGCLWFTKDHDRGLLETDGRGRIAEAVADALHWYPVEVEPGDVVVFDSLAAHRSDTNRSENPRRAMYVTYNPAAEGDFRQLYYDDKAAEFAAADGTFGGDRVRMSINDDFLGRPVS